jgi:hypothetical protein
MARGVDRRIPTPLVLAAASAMVSVGAVAAYVALYGVPGASGGPEGAQDGTRVDVRARSPGEAAESFLDAWRKRAHDVALELSTGPARRSVLKRRKADEQLSKHQRQLKDQVWDEMASSRLDVRVRQTDELENGRLRLQGTAEGRFLDRPYERRISFELVSEEDRWIVWRMELGEILTEVPDFLHLGQGKAQGPYTGESSGKAKPSP